MSSLDDLSKKRKLTADGEAFVDAVLAIPDLLARFARAQNGDCAAGDPCKLCVLIQVNCLTVVKQAEWVVDGSYDDEIGMLRYCLVEHIPQMLDASDAGSENSIAVASALEQVLDAIVCLKADDCQLGQSKRALWGA